MFLVGFICGAIGLPFVLWAAGWMEVKVTRD